MVYECKAYLVEIKGIWVVLHRELTKDTHRTHLKHDLHLFDYKT